jgi:hypothetical protein
MSLSTSRNIDAVKAMINPYGKTGKDFLGPHLWHVIHHFAASYTIEKKDAFLDFLESLCVLMTCDICRCHLKERLKTLQIERYLNNRDDCFFFTYLLHDFVNREYNTNHKSDKNFKRKISPPYEQIKSIYFKTVDNNCKECNV